MQARLLMIMSLGLIGLSACGEEEAAGPMIAAPEITCGTWLGESRIDYEGDVLQKLAVAVSGDQPIVSVTATWDGAIFPLELGESGLYEVETASMPSAVLRCDPDEEILLRAEDSQGIIGERIAATPAP